MNINKQTLSDALDSASFPVIAALMVHFTGDISILNKLPQPSQAVLGETQGFLSEEDKKIIKEFALNEIEKFFENSQKKDLYLPSNNELNKMMNYIVGEVVSPEYAPMMLQEININLVNTQQFKESNDFQSDLEVLIIEQGCQEY